MSKILSGFALLAAGLVLVGCTSEVGGSAGTDTTKAPASSTSSAGSSSKVAPPVRPSVINVNTLDPCKALTADQAKEIGAPTTTRQDADLVKKGKAPGCLYSSVGYYTYNVVLISNEGVGYWRQGSGNVDRKETQVAGYDAIRTNLIGQHDSCSFWVDVADGQMVYVNFLPIDEMTLDQVCDKAQKGTELALATLKTLA
ncbi:DUF3558 domain-containing protein [Umezawaea tangerina]|uniref:Uncharacterized protein DUF3558 n=1 Tax=Umezawaea tangerina TaxID=84725 RepID=A0A2T0SGW8_9PSEU|nr:DUF3558 domain-containing protein [Umezawaea tangerina]PRY32661.1 uncharacterized protein DUF3558 [Umezawaea tangerina]